MVRRGLWVFLLLFLFAECWAHQHIEVELGAPEVRFFVERYLSRDRAWVEASFRRLSYYRDAVVATLRRHGLPEELVVLPILESGYRADARSISGAYGFWQFMRFTARRFGLRVNYWIDERAHIERATEAAASYLEYLYSRFGDWALALAAYNAGEGYVRDVMEATGIDDYWLLCRLGLLDRQVREFVPRFMALLWIYENRSSLGLEIPAGEGLAKVWVPGGIHLESLARRAGIDPALFRELNAFVRRGVTPPSGVRLFVPKRKVAAVVRAYRWMVASMKAKERGIGRLAGYWMGYVVRRGDSLWTISKRFGVSVSLIRLVNGVRGNLIRAGDVLLIPTKRLKAKIVALDERRGILLYRVDRGDTLWKVAKIFGVTYRDLVKENGPAVKRRLVPGQFLKVSLLGVGDENG